MSSVIRGDDNFDSGVAGMSSWTSSNYTWSPGGTYSFTNGLGKMPKIAQVELVCVFAINGYAVGDVAVYFSGERYANWGIQVTEITSSTIGWGVYNAGIVFRRNNSSVSSSYNNSSYFQVRFTLTG